MGWGAGGPCLPLPASVSASGTPPPGSALPGKIPTSIFPKKDAFVAGGGVNSEKDLPSKCEVSLLKNATSKLSFSEKALRDSVVSPGKERSRCKRLEVVLPGLGKKTEEEEGSQHEYLPEGKISSGKCMTLMKFVTEIMNMKGWMGRKTWSHFIPGLSVGLNTKAQRVVG